MPYPGRSHINPMMNLCKLIASRKDDILITFVVTKEWLGFISSDFHHNDNICPVTIPNVIPSELGRGSEFLGFFEPVMTKTEAPFEQILHQLQLPVAAIINDAILSWTIPLGSSRNILVAALWTALSSQILMLSSRTFHNKVDMDSVMDYFKDHVNIVLAASSDQAREIVATN